IRRTAARAALLAGLADGLWSIESSRQAPARAQPRQASVRQRAASRSWGPPDGCERREESDDNVDEIPMNRPALKPSDSGGNPASRTHDRVVERLFEPRAYFALERDRLDEIRRVGMCVDGEVLRGPVQLGEHAAQRLGECRRRV